jgi:hypothetical protein
MGEAARLRTALDHVARAPLNPGWPGVLGTGRRGLSCVYPPPAFSNHETAASVAAGQQRLSRGRSRSARLSRSSTESPCPRPESR